MRRLVELCGTSLFVFHGCGRVAELVARPAQCGNQSRKRSLTKKSAVRQSQRARKKNNDRHEAWSKATNPDKTGSAEEGRGLPRGSICARRVSTPSGLHLMRRQHRLAFRREYVPVRYEAVLKRLVPSAPRNFVAELAHVRTTGGLLLRRSHLSRRDRRNGGERQGQ